MASTDAEKAKQEAAAQAAAAQREAGQAGRDMKAAAGQAAHSVKESASHLAHDAAEAAKGAAHDATEAAKQQGRQAIDQRRHAVSQKVSNISHALFEGAERLGEEVDPSVAQYVSSMAGTVDRAAHYIDERDLGGIADDLQDFTRRHPEWVYGGLFLAGIALARFLKASKQRYRESYVEPQYVMQGRPQPPRGQGGRRPTPGQPGQPYRPTGNQPNPRAGGQFGPGGKPAGTTPLRPEDDIPSVGAVATPGSTQRTS